MAKVEPQTVRIAAGTGEMPRHVAIIMDGNGRWAKKRMLPRAMGHKRGVETVRNIVRAAGELGLETLSLYAFSSENWKRPEEEINDLMALMRDFIKSDLDTFAENDVRLKIIGDYKALSPDIVEMLEESIARTSKNSRTTLAVALNYGSQDEMVRAARAAAAQAAFRIATRKRDEGMLSQVEFLDARTSLTAAELNLNSVRFELLARQAELDYATGVPQR